jgi:hypothetical protein
MVLWRTLLLPLRAHCGYRAWTRTATTSAAAATARRSWFRLTCRRCFGWGRDSGLRCGLRLWSRRATRLDYWSLGGNFGTGAARLVVVEPRLQGLGCFGCFLGRAVSGLLAALQALAHPFAHIAACSTPRTHWSNPVPWRPGYLRRHRVIGRSGHRKSKALTLDRPMTRSPDHPITIAARGNP